MGGRRRVGFTLIELLVVLAIIGVVVGLLLPAVQAAREAARRSRCVNNLKQLALAVQAYADVAGVLPPAAATGPQWSNNFSMKARILPYLEQAALYDSLNQSYFQESGPNATSLTTLVDVFLCPSDPNVPCGTSDLPGAGARQVGYTSYPNNLGTTPANNAGRYDGPAYFMGASVSRSLAGLAPAVGLAAVTDGASNTALWSEMVRGRHGGTTLGPDQVYRLPTPPPAAFTPLPTLLAACGAEATPAGFDAKGQVWGTDSAAQGGGYSHLMTPNRHACLFQGETVPVEWSTVGVGASSFHPGGVNLGYLDGSVRFTRDAVNPAAWWAVATIAGGEVVDGGSASY